MKRTVLLCAVVGFGLACSTGARAQEKGNWRAASKTAQSITGDVVFSDEKLVMNFLGFPIAQIRSLSPAELTAGFDLEANAGGSGRLYRLDIPSTRKFLHKNTLCGAEDTQWMATYVAGRTLQLAFFSGQTPPVFSPEAMASAINLCGTYTYVR